MGVKLSAEDKQWLIDQFEAHRPKHMVQWRGGLGKPQVGFFECTCGHRVDADEVGFDALMVKVNEHLDDEWARVERKIDEIVDRCLGERMNAKKTRADWHEHWERRELSET